MQGRPLSSCVKLQRVVSRTVDDKTYWKYQVVLPSDAVDELGWEEGETLEAEVDAENGQLILAPDDG